MADNNVQGARSVNRLTAKKRGVPVVQPQQVRKVVAPKTEGNTENPVKS